MPIYRYTLPHQCKVRQGAMLKFPCVIGYFGTDEEAELAMGVLNGLQANHGKVGLNKCIMQINSEELTSPATLTDVYDVKVRAVYVDSNNKVAKDQLTILLPNIRPDATDAEIDAFITKCYVMDDTGTPQKVNSIRSRTKTVHNVAAGGPAEEVVNPVQQP